MSPEPPLILNTLPFINPVDSSTIFSLIVLLILLATSALISGAEVAFFALKPHELEKIKTQKSKKAKLIDGFLSKPKELLATILITNNFVNVGIIILATYISGSLIDFQGNEWLQFIIQVIIITFLLLLFGEVLPKVYANNNAVRFVGFIVRPLSIFDKVFKPLSQILVVSSRIIDRKLQGKSHKLSVDDLSNALELTSDENEDKNEKKILEGIVKFGNTDVKQIMRSRIDVTALDQKSSFQQVLKTIRNTGYSRIPIYENSFDKIQGILYIKDLLPYLNKSEKLNWNELIREVFFVPENKKIDDLLKEFQEKKIHLAIVVDEYGGTSGIVTLEDIIEEIVGDISDEFDDDNIIYSKLDEHNYVFEGKTALNDFYRILSIDGERFENAKGESDSLAGFILELTRTMPKKDEKISFDNYTFTIEGVNKRRVTRIKVSVEGKEKQKP
ncbi:gliding motility-associated protein GldE [Flavobacteriales bacterium]|nr:gliding motility-associated protein GldE [Flavobacteriales bacterium]MDB2622009.1 gliding motility-associated protein GldE [Flavobacteriales bacterium]